MPRDIMYQGKVRNLYNFQKHHLIMEATNRLSAFNKHQCFIPHKGQYLNEMSVWWFNETSDIIPNHYLWHRGQFMMVKKTRAIKLEFIVRAYITGSLWKDYENGRRNMYGFVFPDGMVKDQKFDTPIITPTYKNATDDPITEEEILKQNFLTEDELEFLKQKSLELFSRGTELSSGMGLTLVDTKYEFGRDLNNSIILIDEIHTCDSSRYWSDNEHLDKQVIRDWISAHPTDEISNEIKQKVEMIYKNYALLLNPTLKNDEITLNIFLADFKQTFDNFVCVIVGSTSDKEHVEKITSCLKEFNVNYNIMYASAHKETQKVSNYIREQDTLDRKMVWITIAGRSNALSGVVASNSKFPVFACPPFNDNVDMMININSTIQMPSNVPVALILKPRNLSLFIHKMFTSDNMVI